MSTGESERPRFKLHWHVVLTHFPVSGFTGAFLFMVGHLLTHDPCMARASFITLLASTIVLMPVTYSGWVTWRKDYKAFMNKVFRAKIRTALVMVPVSLALVAYQTRYPVSLLDPGHRAAHALYFAGLALLMLGSMVEGYFGGRLHHR